MNTLILNRESFQMPADGWYQIAPRGEFAHAQAGLVQVVDSEACDAMVNRFREDAGTEPFDKLRAQRFAGLLVDFDHFSLDGEKRSETVHKKQTSAENFTESHGGWQNWKPSPDP